MLKLMPAWLIGKTGYAFFDNSSIIHFAFWVFWGSFPYYMGWSYKKALFIGIPIALAWEVFELVVAPKYPGIWKHPESVWNAWASDPLMCVLGVAFSYYILKNWTV